MATYSRQHFEATAQILGQRIGHAQKEGDQGAVFALRQVAQEFRYLFACENGRFDAGRFKSRIDEVAAGVNRA